MKHIITALKNITKLFLLCCGVTLGLFVCYMIFCGDNKGDEVRCQQINYKIRYDSLRVMDSLKDIIIVGQMRARKQLEHKNDSIKKVLRVERICAGKFLYPKKRHNAEIKNLTDVSIELKTELREKDSMLVFVTNLYNKEHP